MKRVSSMQGGAFLRGSLKSNGGQSLVEFALVAPLFFLLIFGVLDLGRVLFTQMTLQHALRQAGRYAVTGNHITQGGTNLSRVASIKQIAQNAAAGLNVNPSSIIISSVSGGNGSAGGPQDTVTVSLTTTLKLITPFIGRYFGPNGYTFTVATTFRNEPFPPANAN